MAYEVVTLRSAQKQIAAFAKPVRARVFAAIVSLQDNPRPPNCRKLAGNHGEYRLRVGDYRIVYLIDDALRRVEVIRVGHRSDVCRG